VTACRHLSTIFVTPPPAPRSLTAIAAPRLAWNPLTAQAMFTAARAASGVARDLPSHQGGAMAPPDGPPHAAHTAPPDNPQGEEGLMAQPERFDILVLGSGEEVTIRCAWLAAFRSEMVRPKERDTVPSGRHT
jgi:hypothetical protein